MTDRYPFLLRLLAGTNAARLEVSAEDFERRMRRLFGLSFLDDGLFSRVYALPGRDDVVVKINRGDQGVDGWPAYASFLRGHQDNPHAPRIHAFRTFVGSDGVRGYVAVMERLVATVTALKSAEWVDRLGSARVSDIALLHMQAQYMVDYGHERGPDMPDALVTLCAAIRAAFNGIFEFDLHGRNAMIRADGTLVLTDPLSFKGERLGEAAQTIDALFAA